MRQSRICACAKSNRKHSTHAPFSHSRRASCLHSHPAGILSLFSPGGHLVSLLTRRASCLHSCSVTPTTSFSPTEISLKTSAISHLPRPGFGRAKSLAFSQRASCLYSHSARRASCLHSCSATPTTPFSSTDFARPTEAVAGFTLP